MRGIPGTIMDQDGSELPKRTPAVPEPETELGRQLLAASNYLRGLAASNENRECSAPALIVRHLAEMLGAPAVPDGERLEDVLAKDGELEPSGYLVSARSRDGTDTVENVHRTRPEPDAATLAIEPLYTLDHFAALTTPTAVDHAGRPHRPDDPNENPDEEG